MSNGFNMLNPRDFVDTVMQGIVTLPGHRNCGEPDTNAIAGRLLGLTLQASFAYEDVQYGYTGQIDPGPGPLLEECRAQLSGITRIPDSEVDELAPSIELDDDTLYKISTWLLSYRPTVRPNIPKKPVHRQDPRGISLQMAWSFAHKDK